MYASFLTPLSLPKWIRASIANKIASNNIEWKDTFIKYNSGTHNNQWVIFDLNNFKEKSDLYNKNKDISEFNNIVLLIEQYPYNKSYSKDISNLLINNSHIATYNTPFFQETYELSGYKDHNRPDYEHTHRKLLLDSLLEEKFYLENYESNLMIAKEVIQYFDETDICDTISPRCDELIKDKRYPFGGVDGKLLLASESPSNYIISGPAKNKLFGKFCFSKYFPEYTHYGIPDCIDNDWIKIVN